MTMVEMEIKEAEKIVIAKPVASRPSSSSFGSFTELLAGAINGSQSKSCSATALAPIRPTTLSLKPVVDHISAEVVSPQAAVCFPSATSDTKSNVVYRPMAKRASCTTVSVLEHSWNSNAISQRKVAEIETNVQELAVIQSLPKLGSKAHQESQVQSEEKERKQCRNPTSDTLAEDHNSLQQTSAAGHSSSSDGYNWRKYGQKLVKGSEYPRSYYKCTHLNCPVKKKVERSPEGQFAEIVYRGEHNHSKPATFTPGLSDRQRLSFVTNATGNERNNPPWNKQLGEKNECYEGKVKNGNDVGSSGHSTHSSCSPFYDPMMTGEFHSDVNADDNSLGLHEVCNEVTMEVEGEGNGHKGKRRRHQDQHDVLEMPGEGTKEQRIIVKNPSDSEIIGDGFHWRKYGQKVVKGNPRSYYRCTSLECNVRKYVERTSNDPRAFVTTYEGKHNHDMPNKISRRHLR